MICPGCRHEETRVVDSRAAGDAIRRRRACEACGLRFTTHERVEERVSVVVKRDGTREPWQRDKVLRGVTLACRKRPVDATAIEGIVRAVEAALAARDGEVTSAEVGDAVLTVLAGTDAVATVRFASVYRAFESADQFVEAIAPFRRPG